MENKRVEMRGGEMDEIISFIRGVPLFQDFTENELHVCRKFFHRVIFSPGDVLVEEGERINGFSIIESGECDVVIRGGPGESSDTIATLQPGEIIGELSFLLGTHAQATVIARGVVHALYVPFDEMTELFYEKPEIERKFYRALAHILAQRLKRTNENLIFLRRMFLRTFRQIMNPAESDE